MNLQALQNRRILIIGGTGSLGGALLRRLAFHKVRPQEVVILSRDEQKHYAMRNEWAAYDFPVIGELGDVLTTPSLPRLVTRADFIIYAAACKHVPSTEQFISAAVDTNVRGVLRVSELLRRGTIDKPRVLVAISTDKACMPINVMGMTKAIQERVVLNTQHGDRLRSNVVRYGNVIASKGSALPIFLEKLQAGDTVPVTHEGMTRFLFSLDDASDLCLYALTSTQTGKVIVPELKSAYIISVVEEMARQLGVQAKVAFTGIRAGEKMHEDMVTPEERSRGEYVDDGYFAFHPNGEVGEVYTQGICSATSLMTGEELSSIISNFLACNGL